MQRRYDSRAIRLPKIATGMAALALMTAGLSPAWSGSAPDIDIVRKDQHGTAGPDSSGAAAPAAQQAMSSAQKLVAPAGAALGSTEGVDTSVKAAGPSLRMDPGSTESQAVRGTAELIKMIRGRDGRKTTAGVPDLKETSASLDIFGDPKAILEKLGPKPRVIYMIVVGAAQEKLPDPMIIPWIMNNKVAEQQFEAGLDLIEKGDVQAGRRLLQEIVEDYPGTEWATQAQEIVSKIPAGGPVARAVAPGQRNPQVRPSTVMVDPTNPRNSRAMILGRAYATGDRVRDYPDHIVGKITEDSVAIAVEKNGIQTSENVPVKESATGTKK